MPISSVLRRRSERETAQLEDDVVTALFSVTSEVALHGGTAVWRCYGGKRFSKDLDIYVWAKNFRDLFIDRMTNAGIDVSKYREKGITFIHVKKGDTEIKIEPKNVQKAAVLAPYERVDGTRINILALSAEDIILEKIDTYNSRRGYKDLYDITVLLNNVRNPEKIKAALKEFAKNVTSPDEQFQNYSEFKALIYSGLAPSFDKMVEFIKGWSL